MIQCNNGTLSSPVADRDVLMRRVTYAVDFARVTVSWDSQLSEENVIAHYATATELEGCIHFLPYQCPASAFPSPLPLAGQTAQKITSLGKLLLHIHESLTNWKVIVTKIQGHNGIVSPHVIGCAHLRETSECLLVRQCLEKPFIAPYTLTDMDSVFQIYR